ncbi:unnamed protein product, partial [Protopolystoma xenopodis]
MNTCTGGQASMTHMPQGNLTDRQTDTHECGPAQMSVILPHCCGDLSANALVELRQHRSMAQLTVRLLSLPPSLTHSLTHFVSHSLIHSVTLSLSLPLSHTHYVTLFLSPFHP